MILKNNLKIALRTIVKQRMYAVLNVLGLSVGMASCLLIAFHVNDQTSYDKFYKDYENVYRITTYWKQEEGIEHYAAAPPALGPMLVEQSPDVLSMVRINSGSDLTMRSEDNFDRPFRETNAWTVDSTFFDVLNFGFLEGDYERLFTKDHTLVMPVSTAVRYFGQEAVDNHDVVGRILGGGGDGGTKWEVVGLIEDQPQNSHFQFDMLLSRENPEALNIPNWGWNIFHTYIKIRDNSSQTIARIDQVLESIVAEHGMARSNVSLEYLRDQGLDWKYILQPIADIHLNPSLLREMRPKGNRLYVNALIVVAIFIMVLAVVNFVNLSTAKSTIRAKEIGVKKVLGSGRRNLIYQFLTESLVFAYLSMVMALGLVEGMVQLLRVSFQWEVETSLLLEPINWLIIVVSTGFIGFLAGIYPALYLTGFKPVAVLKGDLKLSSAKSPMRNLLVGFQFVVSIGLIISALVIKEQVEYTKSKDLGFEKENVLVIQNDREIDDRREEFKTALRKNPDIAGVSFATGLPGQLNYARRDFSVDGGVKRMGINWFKADNDYLNTLNLRVAQGRAFEKAMATDSSGLLLNQQAVKELGLTEPIGQFLTINQGDPDEERVQIIGVLEDFNTESFDKAIKPLAITFLNDYRFKDYIAIKIKSQDLSETLEFIETAWDEFEPNVPLVYSFLDKDFEKLFKSELQLSRIFSAFTMLAIFIACLGLFGLASFINEQRTKEIGIRKVLGASLSSILLLLYRSYFRLILLSFVIASALAVYFMRDWLEGFAYRVDLSAVPFVMALLGTFTLAVLTVSHQSIKAAHKNPVETLKTE